MLTRVSGSTTASNKLTLAPSQTPYVSVFAGSKGISLTAQKSARTTVYGLKENSGGKNVTPGIAKCQTDSNF